MSSTQTTPQTVILKKPKPVPLHEIVEVRECGSRAANFFLRHGYTLLAVTDWAVLREKPRAGDGVMMSYVVKDARYVLGRTADVESVENPDFPGEKASGG